MKILFKNNTKYTREKYRDFLEFHKNKYGKKLLIKLIGFFICLLYIIIFNIIYRNWILIISLAIILGLLYLVNQVKKGKQQKKNQKIIKKTKEFTFLFYENMIKIKCGRKADKLRYFELHKIFETKEYFFLYTDETHSLIVSKDGFEIGNAKMFSDFIRKKCPLKFKKEKI